MKKDTKNLLLKLLACTMIVLVISPSIWKKLDALFSKHEKPKYAPEENLTQRELARFYEAQKNFDWNKYWNEAMREYLRELEAIERSSRAPAPITLPPAPMPVVIAPSTAPSPQAPLFDALMLQNAMGLRNSNQSNSFYNVLMAQEEMRKLQSELNSIRAQQTHEQIQRDTLRTMWNIHHWGNYSWSNYYYPYAQVYGFDSRFYRSCMNAYGNSMLCNRLSTY